MTAARYHYFGLLNLEVDESPMSILLQMDKRDALDELLSQRILLLDGSLGALIFSKKTHGSGLSR